MKEVVHKIRHNAQPRRSCYIIAVSGKLARLETSKCSPLLKRKVGAVAIELCNRLLCNRVAVAVIRKREAAMGNEVGKEERGWLGRRLHRGMEDRGDRWRWVSFEDSPGCYIGAPRQVYGHNSR